MDLHDAIAVAAFALSILLAAIRIAEWRAKPDLRASVDWLTVNR